MWLLPGCGAIVGDQAGSSFRNDPHDTYPCGCLCGGIDLGYVIGPFEAGLQSGAFSVPFLDAQVAVLADYIAQYLSIGPT